MKYRAILTMVLGLALVTATAQTHDHKSHSSKGPSGTMNLQKDGSSIAWTGKKVTGGHDGNIKFKNGYLQFADGVVTSGKFDVDMKSISNNDIEDEATRAKLVGHLNSDDFFSTSTFPVATFTITKATPKAKAGKNGENYEITGNMKIKGITNSITFPARIEVKGDKVMASAKVVLDRSKWDVRYGSGSFFDNLGDNLIYDDFTLNMKMAFK